MSSLPGRGRLFISGGLAPFGLGGAGFLSSKVKASKRSSAVGVFWSTVALAMAAKLSDDRRSVRLLV